LKVNLFLAESLECALNYVYLGVSVDPVKFALGVK